MKKLKIVMVLVWSCLFYTGYAQKSKKLAERESNKVDTLYTYEEKGNLQIMFNKEVEKMRLSASKSSSYFNIMASYGYDMSRLDDRDKEYSEEEIKNELHKIVEKMNAEIKDLLNKRQYIVHLDMVGKWLYGNGIETRIRLS